MAKADWNTQKGEIFEEYFFDQDERRKGVCTQKESSRNRKRFNHSI